MFAAKSFRQRFTERGALGKIHNHANPRHGLEEYPMRPQRKRQGQNHHDFRKARQIRGIVIDPRGRVKLTFATAGVG
jgi:hypothetical protein